MTQKSLMILNEAQESIEGLIDLGARHNLVLMRDAAGALSFLRRNPVDLILLREEEAGMDALEFLMNLQDLRLPTHVIVFYDRTLPIEERQLREMTNVSFLKGPISSDDLERIIDKLETAAGYSSR